MVTVQETGPRTGPRRPDVGGKRWSLRSSGSSYRHVGRSADTAIRVVGDCSARAKHLSNETAAIRMLVAGAAMLLENRYRFRGPGDVPRLIDHG
jgi:hypothetical protein